MSDETLVPRQVFLDMFQRDRRDGRQRSLSEYLAAIPGDEAQIAAEYLAAHHGGSVVPPCSPSSTPSGYGSSDTGGRAEPGSSIGPYRIIKELGRGGQGVVFLAEDARLSRKVALKVLTNLGMVPESVLTRFRREAEVASKLDHPGICGVFETGTYGSVPYIAMRYIEGKSLKDMIGTAINEKTDSIVIDLENDDNSPTASDAQAATTDRREVVEIVALIEKAARALHAAHEVGVIHRDIKPQNIMLTAQSEPIILDFGLARDLEDDQVSLTQSGDLFGTPAYMSPEQVTGRIALDRRTDIYSLGVTLFECLTLKRPFEAATREQLYQAILTEPPVDPRRANPAVSNDLRVVIDTALDKNRERRYSTALEFAEDLRRVRLYEPIRARPAGPFLRLVRWTQRQPALATTVASLIVLALVASALLSYGLGEKERAAAETKARKLEMAEADRVSAEKGVLEQKERDREFSERLDNLSQTLGFALGPTQGQLDVCPIARDFLILYRDYGVTLDGEEPPPQVAARIRQVFERGQAEGRLIMSGLYDLCGLLEVSEVSRAAELIRGTRPSWADDQQVQEWREEAAAEPILTPFWHRLVEIIAAAEPDAWRLDVWGATRAFWALREDRFANYVTEEFLAKKNPEELSWIAGMITAPKLDRPESMDITNRALDLAPASFGLHFLRAGLSLMHLQQPRFGNPKTPEDQKELAEHLQAVQLHLSIAIALRPDSPLLYGLLGHNIARLGDGRRGMQFVEKMVVMAPEMSLAWLIRGMFYKYAPMPWAKDRARESLRKAIELDEKLAYARELLADLDKGQ